MVNTPRINLLKDINFIIPAITGLIVLIYVSFLAATFILRKNEETTRELVSKRDQMLLEYESYQANFSSLLSDVLLLSVQNVPTDFTYTLAQFENENTILQSLSKDILRTAQKAKTGTIDVDEIRVNNHDVYAKLIDSLGDFQTFVIAEASVKKCYGNINLKAKDKEIISAIDICNGQKELFTINYKQLTNEYTEYWSSYTGYWDTVRAIHNNPNKNSVAKLQQDLKSYYNKIQSSSKPYIQSLENYFKDSILKEIKAY